MRAGMNKGEREREGVAPLLPSATGIARGVGVEG